jgi:hypothetical protein
MKLENFNKKYKYKSDTEKFNTSLDIWELPKDSDLIEADCESYCRYLKNYVEGFSDWDYFYCKLNGVGHCVLAKDGFIIDCNVQNVIKLSTYKEMYIVTDFKKYNWFVVASKIIVGNIIVWYKNLVK